MAQGVEWGLHVAVVLALMPDGAAMPAARLAEFHGVPAAYLAKNMQAMARAGLVESVSGARGGYRLAKPAGDITVLDVVEAIDGSGPAFRCTEIRQRGPAAVAAREYRAPCTIARTMYRAEEAWRRELRAQTIADLAAGLATAINPPSAKRASQWFQEVMR